MHLLEMELVKYLVNNKMHMFINKRPIHREVLLKVNNMPVTNLLFDIWYSKYEYILAEQPQGFEQQGQQGNGFVQNVQYQTIPQYGVSS